MRKSALLVLAFAVALVIGSTAVVQADTMPVLVNQVGYDYRSTVNISTTVKPYSGNVYVERFNLVVTYPDGSWYQAPAYCVDLGDWSQSSFWAWDESPAGDYLLAAWLMDTYEPMYNGAFDTYTEKETSNALQIAIWEAIYDVSADGAWDLSSGAFALNSATSNVYTLAGIYLDSLLAALDAGPITLAQLNQTYHLLNGDANDPNSQTLLAPTPSSTPEPGTMVLFGSAAGLFGYLRRRQTRRLGGKKSKV